MTSEGQKDLLETAAKTVSIIFHPLLMPLYGITIIFSAPTLFGYLPFEIKKLLFLIILVNNILLPLSLMPFYYHRHIITSWTISERKERNIPLLITTILYATTSYIIFKFPVPVFLKTFIFSTALLSVVVTVVNLRWKISLHSVGAGALISLVLILSVKMLTPLEGYLITAFVSGGLILSSRLKLNLHSPAQVWLGLSAGFFGLTLFMLVL